MMNQRGTTRIAPRVKALAMLVAMAVAPACERHSVEEVETTATVPVVVETAKIGLLQGMISATGVVTAAPGAELTVIAPASARIAYLQVGEGDQVKEGDVLVRFDIPSLTADVSANRAKVSQAIARIDAAKANVTRLSSLLEQGVAAPRDLEEARRQQAEAEGDLEQARSAVDASVALSERAVVRAPFAGVVAQRSHNPGDLVEPAASDPVLKVINPAKLQVMAAVPASDVSRVVVGHSAEVRQTGSDASETATVLTRAPQIDPATGAGTVRLGFTKPTSLTAGLTVQVDIVGEERRDVLMVPTAAVVNGDGERFVMVAGPDNKAHKQEVSVGLATTAFTQVTKGINAGDRVIVRGQEALPDGAAIVVESR